MKTNKKSIDDILSTPVPEIKSLKEQCEEYGIEYHEPYFEFVWAFDKSGAVYPAAWYYLSDDISNKPDLQKAINKYNMYLTSGDAFAEIKYFGAYHNLRKLEKKYSIHRYTKEERDEYVANYKKEKTAELKKAKAIVEVVKKEIALEK